ncbi:hypothetical protein HY3_15505 [Hyphomonas pacifica]|uniref:Uncharacterized protein n=1 Tax=Hyphomonas pacifica TaxID=1280941 RepID=A0A062TR28_9PROT|nr:hypothetical protein HY2_14920 [Hyphomonas pacifica]RAN32202.1 hypothetical protein HY3_15505 [Hyphomonas pacifica]
MGAVFPVATSFDFAQDEFGAWGKKRSALGSSEVEARARAGGLGRSVSHKLPHLQLWTPTFVGESGREGDDRGDWAHMAQAITMWRECP